MNQARQWRLENRVTVRLYEDFAEKEQAPAALFQALKDISRAGKVASGPMSRDTTSLPEQNHKEE